MVKVMCLGFSNSVERLSGLAVGRRERGGGVDRYQMCRNGPAMSCVRVCVCVWCVSLVSGCLGVWVCKLCFPCPRALLGFAGLIDI